jgi:hypothetical protein
MDTVAICPKIFFSLNLTAKNKGLFSGKFFRGLGFNVAIEGLK